MAERCYFFNAFNVNGNYDRKYNANDLSNLIKMGYETGIVKDELQVTAGNGLSINIAIGRAVINGKGYENDAVLNLTIPAAPTGSDPYYYPVVIHFDDTQTLTGRYIQAKLLTPLTTVPTVSNLDQSNEEYDLMLAYVKVNPYGTAPAEIVDTRGVQDLCPWFKVISGEAISQRFFYTQTLGSATTQVVTNLSSYLYTNSLGYIDVYCNGLCEDKEDYTIVTTGAYVVIQFTAQKVAGTEVSVTLNRFLNGSNITDPLEEYSEFVNDVENLKEAYSYTYVCNGTTDNKGISDLVNSLLTDNNYNSYNIKIVGTFGWTSWIAGAGTSANPYRLFNFNSTNSQVVLDFTNCSQISISASAIYVWCFVGYNLHVKGLNLVANGTSSGTCIRAFANTVVCENSRFWINGYGGSWIAQSGTFTNCRGSILNASGNSYCFLTSNVIKLIGGEYYAYCVSGNTSAIIGQSADNTVSILYGVSAPTAARSGYLQTKAINQLGTSNYVNCTDLISELTLTVVSGKSNVRGTIPYSKTL